MLGRRRTAKRAHILNRALSTCENLEQRCLLTGSFPNAQVVDTTFDSDGNLHVAYYHGVPDDLAVERDVRYAKRLANGTWSSISEIWPGSSVRHGSSLSIAIDNDNRPGIAYRDDTNTALKYAHFNGTSW